MAQNDSISQVVAKCDQPEATALALYTQEDIQSRIYTIRGVQVMLDRDLAQLYEVETKNLNKAVKRNIERFPEDFMFQLTKEEWEDWKSQIVTANVGDSSLRFQNVTSNNDDEALRFQTGTSRTARGGVRYLPYAFTEEGVSQLSSVLHSQTAVEMSIRITRAFVAMRKFITTNAGMFQRIESLERHQLETDQKIDRVLDCLEEGTLKEKAHIFSAGQIYEAKAFITPSTSSGRAQLVTNGIYIYTQAC